MRKRKSIGNDPLDWMGEPGTLPKGEGRSENTIRQEDEESATGSGNGSTPDSGSGILPLAPPPTTYALERQLLLVDGFLREGGSRPRLNQVLWILLFLLTLLGVGILFFQEIRRQWSERILSLQGTIERIEKEKGRNESILEQVISEKDNLIREKEGTLSRIESLHETVLEELRVARAETRRLREENQTFSKESKNPSGRPSARKAKSESESPSTASPGK